MSDRKPIRGQCPNGHFYLKSKYASCPYCEKVKAAVSQTDHSIDQNNNSAKEDLPANVEEKAVKSDDSKTISYYNVKSVDPVVGWLVCIKGEHYGECFNLYSGRNEIGRSAEMDISLPKDLSISRKTHAVLIFEPRYKKFYLQSGDSHGLAYLDGEIIVSHKELFSRCIVALGNSVFIFIALCNSDFNWSDTEKYCK